MLGGPMRVKQTLVFLTTFVLFWVGAKAVAQDTVAAQIKKEQFTSFLVAGNQKVEAIRLFEAAPKVPGRVAWLEPSGGLQSATDEDFIRLSPISWEQTTRKPQKIKGHLKMNMPQIEMSRNFYDTDKTSTFMFLDGSTEIEISCVVVSDPGPPPPTYRVAFAWRIKKGTKIKESNSSVATVMEGTEVPIPLIGSSHLEGEYQVTFLIEEKPQ